MNQDKRTRLGLEELHDQRRETLLAKRLIMQRRSKNILGFTICKEKGQQDADTQKDPKRPNISSGFFWLMTFAIVCLRDAIQDGIMGEEYEVDYSGFCRAPGSTVDVPYVDSWATLLLEAYTLSRYGNTNYSD